MRRLPQKSRKLQRRRCRRSRLPKKRRRMKPCPQEKDQDPEAEVEVTDPELAEILSRAQVLLDSSAGGSSCLYTGRTGPAGADTGPNGAGVTSPGSTGSAS